MLSAEIRSYIHDHKKELFEKLMQARRGNEYKEENFRQNHAIMLDDLFKTLGLHGNINIENEFTVLEGRIDSVYGNFIIEYKYPTRLSCSNTSGNAKFIEQVQRQIKGFQKRTGLPFNKIMGVIFDGYYAIYVKMQGDDWSISIPQEMTVDSYELFLMRLLSVNSNGKALLVDNLIKDFGFFSEQSRHAISVLYNKLENNKKINKTKILFEQWQTLYREVCGYSFETRDLKIKGLKEQYSLQGEAINYPYLIFSIQTYFSLLIKVLSLNILAYLKNSTLAGKIVFHTENFEKLKNDFRDIEEGGIFRRLGILNFLEGDFFSWYLYLWDDEIGSILQELIETFEKYDYSIIVLEREMAKDLLKNLYYELLPSVLRRNLGEFYTPDWLAEFLIEDLQPEIKEDTLFLDPTCGSGTFLVILIKKIMNYYGSGIASENLLKIIINSVSGYDLNPLAVICARANYIIALGDLLSECEEPIEIPVYLCDAMLTILEGYEESKDCYLIPTKAETFILPKKLIDIKVINHVLDIANDSIHRDSAWESFELTLNTALPQLGQNLSEKEYQELKEFYLKMRTLNERNLDGVWANVIKNAFAPVFQRKVDYIVGNPPWIDWQNLPENYRESIQKYWYDYRVFDHKGQKAQLGSAHDDISVLMTYVIMDNFLKDGGKLAFVINQNLLQASGGGDGFRKFTIKEKIPVSVKSVNDFVEVGPFKDLGVSNKTATIILQKNEINTYPVVYNKWHKREKKVIVSDADMDDVLNRQIACKKFYASPINEYNSPWMIATASQKKMFDKMINKDAERSSYRARKGVDTSANAIFWVKEKKKVKSNLILVDNSPENSRKEISHICDFPLETNYIYPLLRGKDVKKWRYSSELSIILPYTKDGKVVGKKELLATCPNMFDYFFMDRHGFDSILKERAIYKKFILRQDEHAPEYSLYNIGEYTFSSYKVIWKALAKGVEAVTISNKDDRMLIPDHNLLMVPLEDEMEAYYLTGVLNSDIVSEFVNAYVAWFISGHILERINIPKYSEKNMLHSEIAKLSKEAHFVAGDENRIEEVEKELNKKVTDLLLNPGFRSFRIYENYNGDI